MHPKESNIYVSGKETIVVIHRICSDTTPTDEVKMHTTFHEFCHQFDRFLASAIDSQSVVASMLSSIQIPDEDHNLLWKELDYSPEKLVPLYGLGDIITRIAEPAACVANKVAASEHKLAEMIITIDKHTVIPEEEIRRLLRSSLDNSDRMEHQVTYHDTDDYDHAGGRVEDEDDYDHDYYDEYRAIEDRL
ncbi:hypothetical protein TIFTF001_003706 [Ficus carica]|uniref:Uncharacterized protein n=1 Tax=Ficus carica TaxID=3494 RepID=A0AA88CVX9_FICCA|nr:hypothetical protein TIFTF001_003706 [Ficus carica]